MKYKCLILDHDDTVVNSTVQVHYPSMMECLRELRPKMKMGFDEFNMLNFELGFHDFMYNYLGFSEEEAKREEEIWRSWTERIRPDFFDGFRDIINSFKSCGGIVMVSTHSCKDTVIKDYKAAGCVLPDEIFGWELPNEKRKPDLYGINYTMDKYNLTPKDMIMVDDMKHGVVMCKNAGIECVFADWNRKPPKIIDYMTENCDFTIKAPSELKNILF